jgi:hypothetical protein
VKNDGAAKLLRALPAHVAMGAGLGLLTFLILVACNNANVSDMIASGAEPNRTFFMLAIVFALMFALPCGLTGLLFMASEAQE